jgi:predicted AAA+ superfamily ATPase
MKQFGREYYKNTVYISFDEKPALNRVLEDTLSPAEILPLIQAETNERITKDTLIIFDEVQESPRALMSLKYFCENAGEYHIIAAGSTLGVMLHQHNGFPVGKVEFLDLHPMTFNEFLMASGQEELAAFLRESPADSLKAFHEKLIRLLRQYFYVGGMPAAVKTYAETGDFKDARRMQKTILTAYEKDFSKYARESFSSKLRMLWAAIPSQLSKENKKFVYGAVKNGARGRDFETVIQWMKDSSLIGTVHRITKPFHPVKAYEDMGAFKLFVNDLGLLSAMVDLDMQMIADPKALFVEFKGALSEQFVFQELRAQKGSALFYWSNDKGSAEIDFLLEDGAGLPIPVEVKSGINLRAKSLKFYMETWKPPYAIRTSLGNYKIDSANKIIDMPLYAVEKIGPLLSAAPESPPWVDAEAH